MHHLSVDIETYSSVDLKKSGLYKYAQSPDFQVMLFAWSLDGSPVQVVDLMEQAKLPNNIVDLLLDPNTIKHAYNAAFEWYCLSQHLNFYNLTGYPAESWLNQWRCTMLHGLYCGYTTSLDATGAALGLQQEKQKLSSGGALMRYFCVPCKPSRANGNRARNYPRHDPGKWAAFKEYCRQDVVTEMEVERRLVNFPVPDEIQAQWVTDQIINARGVAVDTEQVAAAIWCGDTVHDRLMSEAVEISGLANPNSRDQLKRWLERELNGEIPDLRKDTVDELIKRGVSSPAATRMLEIRQDISRTSTKKYDTLETAVCEDGRVRGLLQFYGANRTGRWAGRIVQPQNLPRTYITALPIARQLVKDHALDALTLAFGKIPDTLSQLIRTAFVAAPGNTLVDVDFSSIEARVIAWLAGEDWVLEVFRTHGKIYEATAAQMFNIPFELIKKGNPEYAYRQRGKVATLALGYQGSKGALINMGALRDGIPEEELPGIVSLWRQSNPNIVNLWYSAEAAAHDTVLSGKPCMLRGLTFARECDPANGQDFMTIRLPSGRKLYYAKPHFGTNKWGNRSLCYYGMNQTSKKWQVIETYGGKIVENIVQAIARDCLAGAIMRLESAGYQIVFHVHDEVIIEIPANEADLDAVIDVMSQPVPWAPGLPVGADGWINEFYKKD